MISLDGIENENGTKIGFIRRLTFLKGRIDVVLLLALS